MTLKYSAMPLNRHSALRKDKTWLTRQFQSTNCRFFPVSGQLNYFEKEPAAQAKYLTRERLGELTLDMCIFIGVDDQGPVFAFNTENLTLDCRSAIDSHGAWCDLRKIGPTLSDVNASILALGKGLVHWHKHHSFCGLCGEANSLAEAGHSRLCINSTCQHQMYPRTDPAVIMLVEKTFADGKTRCLMGRQASWPQGVYSTLAGFVDPGETLEEAVIREVKEEANIDVGNVRYIASQPWPFPSSIMLGFIATAINEDIQIEQDELDDARWFTRDEVKRFDEWLSDSQEYKKTRSDSISRYLIDGWQNKTL